MIFRVQLNDLRFDLLIDRQNIRRLVDVLFRDLRDVQQGVDARFQLDECAEIGHSGDASRNDCAGGVLFFGRLPRVLIRELKAQRDLIAVDVLDEDFELFTDLSVWMGIRRTIDRVNANALAA